LQSAESFSSVDGSVVSYNYKSSEKEEVMLQGKDVKTLPSYGCIFETIVVENCGWPLVFDSGREPP
jgi:hypothetical protein